jgi:hypothetical protein
LRQISTVSASVATSICAAHLAAALPRMLVQIEAGPAAAGPRRARPPPEGRIDPRTAQRRGGDHLPRRDLERGRRLGSRSSGVGGLAGGGGAGAIGPSFLPFPERLRRGAGAVERGGIEILHQPLWAVTPVLISAELLGLPVCRVTPPVVARIGVYWKISIFSQV